MPGDRAASCGGMMKPDVVFFGENVPRRYRVLGTDGFGRSDYRKRLRDFFEVDRHWIAVAALKTLADEGTVKPTVVAEAIARYGIDPEKPAPWTV